MNSFKNKYSQLIKLQSVLFQQNIPFVSYRLAQEAEIISLVQHHSLPEKLVSLNNIGSETGFVISAFQTDNLHATYLLKPDCVFFSDNIDDVFIQKLAANNRFLSDKNKPLFNYKTTEKEDFINNVNNALDAIAAGFFHKVVLSKTRVETLNDDFSAAHFFLKLCDKYPNAMVYLLQMPGVGCWIGATPELLLNIDSEVVKTVSLAGTQLATGAELNIYKWTDKEIDEQAIVTKYIEGLLTDVGIEKFKKSGPNNIQAANLIHLNTVFEFDESQLQDRFSDFLNLLHPTPSVGGLPKKAAKEFILRTEGHDRAYYSGFLGPININNKTNVFVNLRCLQLFNNKFVLYSGAGITSSSVAEKEWDETENKMMTMLNVLAP